MLFIILLTLFTVVAGIQYAPGTFNVTGNSGVPAMHAAVLNNGNVVFLDKIEYWTQLRLPNGRWAYSSIYNPTTHELKPLTVQTNAFCSGGTWLADGRLISLGGNGDLSWLDPTVGDGFDAIRYLNGDGDVTGWSEPGNKLASKRWYASAQTLSDGNIFVAAGSLNALPQANFANNNPTYEILSPQGISDGNNIPMDILINNQPWFMYPFLHLLKDGTLFIFTSRASQVFDASSGQVIKNLPELQGMHRTYPNTGGSVLLPLSKENDWQPEVMICGGGLEDSTLSPTDSSCGRIKPLSDDATWRQTLMPSGRTMVEGVNLLDGTILWINGAQTGVEGFGTADNPAYDALIYDPVSDKWATAGRSIIPRLYHSVALLLHDGAVLIAGSNPNEMPLAPNNINPDVLTTKYPTEFRTEIWTPPYLQGAKASQRPREVIFSSTSFKPGEKFTVSFKPVSLLDSVEVLLYQGGFVTHAIHMGQVMYKCETDGWVGYADGSVGVDVTVPNVKMAPGPYVVSVMANGVPSVGETVMVKSHLRLPRQVGYGDA